MSEQAPFETIELDNASSIYACRDWWRPGKAPHADTTTYVRADVAERMAAEARAKALREMIAWLSDQYCHYKYKQGRGEIAQHYATAEAHCDSLIRKSAAEPAQQDRHLNQGEQRAMGNALRKSARIVSDGAAEREGGDGV